MNDIVQSSGAALRVSPGSGVSIDPASGEVSLDLAALQEGVEFVLAEADAGGTQVAAHRVRVVGVELPLTRFDTAAALGEVRFLGSAAPSWTLGDGFARLVPAATARTHGDWSGAGADGTYRCLFRLKGGLPAAVDRRFSFGARIRLAGADWSGVRIEPFETAAGERRLHVREYTGAAGNTVSLATADVGWAYDAWQWLEVEIAGAAVRGRIYAEGAAAPDWQVSATTRQLAAGTFGPGASRRRGCRRRSTSGSWSSCRRADGACGTGAR